MRFVFASLLLLSSPAFAQQAGAQDSGGLPQLDTALYPGQIFWLIICFGILYAAMAYVALPRVAHTQRNRHHIISAEIKTAHAANDEAKHAAEQVDKMLKEARARAQARMLDMIAEVTEATNQRKAAQEKELQRRLHAAEAKIVVAREAALSALGHSAADLAAAVTAQVTGANRQSAA